MSKLENLITPANIQFVGASLGGLIGSYLVYLEGTKRPVSFAEQQRWSGIGTATGYIIAKILTQERRWN